MTSAKVDSIKTGQEDTERWVGGGCRGCHGNLGVWGPGLPCLHSHLRLGTLPSSREGESSFYKAGSEALAQAPLCRLPLSSLPPSPCLRITLFEWLAPTHWKFATQMHGLYLGGASLP